LDPNMATALSWAAVLSLVPECGIPQLPASLKNVRQRANLAHEINESLPKGDLLFLHSSEEITRRLSETANLSQRYMPDVANPLERINISLRLWAGCLDAAKTIALETRSGGNTPTIRAEIFTGRIDPITRVDPVYAAGVETAPTVKRVNWRQDYSFDGVPVSSIVRRFPAGLPAL
jgi:hypothetical protein